MEKHVLRICEVDRRVFEAIKNGSKTIETRAAKPKYQTVAAGDNLIFICGKDRLSKKVKSAKRFKSIKAILAEYDFKQIMPFANSPKEAREIWYSFPGNKQAIAQFGLMAFEME